MPKPIDYGKPLNIAFYLNGEKKYKTSVLSKQRVAQGYLITWLTEEKETECTLLKTSQNGHIMFQNSETYPEARVSN